MQITDETETGRTCETEPRATAEAKIPYARIAPAEWLGRSKPRSPKLTTRTLEVQKKIISRGQAKRSGILVMPSLKLREYGTAPRGDGAAPKDLLSRNILWPDGAAPLRDRRTEEGAVAL